LRRSDRCDVVNNALSAAAALEQLLETEGFQGSRAAYSRHWSVDRGKLVDEDGAVARGSPTANSRNLWLCQLPPPSAIEGSLPSSSEGSQGSVCATHSCFPKIPDNMLSFGILLVGIQIRSLCLVGGFFDKGVLPMISYSEYTKLP
jgi:hypothetical protein